mgnify:CR=1 FL=1
MCIRDREPETHLEVIEKVMDYAKELGFGRKHLEFSPIKGPEGNIEYLVHLKKTQEGENSAEVNAEAVVEAAHGELDRT